MAFLEIRGLRKRFHRMEVLKGIDLELEKGGFLVLLGPSGCGKSTLLNAIAGLETISEGEIRIDGQVVNDVRPSERDIAMVFQSYALYPTMSVAQNIAFGMEMRGVPKRERQEAVQRIAAMLQIGHLLDRRPSQLSGGQRQRVAMGRALVRDPRVFLFDEPLSNLDAKLRVDMRTEIKKLHGATGKTIVYVTHDQIEAMTLGSKIAVLRDGALQQVGTPAEVYNLPTNLFVADFMGSPAMNLLAARVVGRNGAAMLEVARENETAIALRVPPTVQQTRLAAGQEVILGIRPEAITEPSAVDRTSTLVDVVEALVEVVEPAGSDTYVVMRAAEKEVIARMRADADVRPGTRIPFAFDLAKAVVFDKAGGQRLA
jgi:multiple sugar transport system ATP-binding protein